MNRPPGRYPVEVDVRLVEETVLRRVEEGPAAARRAFRAERDQLYELADPEAREAGFRALHGRYFRSLGLRRDLDEALARAPTVTAGTRGCRVVGVAASRDEFADLGPDPERRRPPLLLVRMRAVTLLAPELLRRFLARELLHVADLLDPDFGYETSLAAEADKGAFHNLLLRRYRTLWGTSVDGRLVAAGELSAAAEAERRMEFLRVFPMLAGESDRVFDRFFSGPRPTHAELAAFAAEPGGHAAAAGRCPLCGMACSRPHPAPRSLQPEAMAAIRGDFPEWEPERGLCLQCADLYAAAALPSRSLEAGPR